LSIKRITSATTGLKMKQTQLDVLMQ